MTQLDNQTIFNKVLFGIRGQGYEKSSNGVHCAYRGEAEDGVILKCAVGHCIDDETAAHWDKDTYASGTSIEEVYKYLPEMYSKFFTEGQLDLLQSLQELHDGWLDTNSVDWENEMARLANEYSLVYTPCNV